ncbi:MAG: hypothetical protein Q9213_003383 [Squamulea squamosa]
MAPAARTVPKDNKRLDSIITFATKLEKTLRAAPETVSLLANTLQEHIEGITLVAPSALVDKARDLDERGTRIWNLASKLKDDAKSTQTLALVRAFASLLLDGAQQTAVAAVTNDIRVMKTILKASKYCLGQLSIAERMVERAASYEQRLQKVLRGNSPQDLGSSVLGLSAEYGVLRITLAWHQERLDLAELWLANLSPGERPLTAAVAEQLADTLFEIGRDQVSKRRCKSALQWLDSAHEILASQNPEHLSTDASEVRTCIMHTIIRVLLEERGEENISRAWNIYHELKGESKNKVVVWLLKLELLKADQSAAQDYYEVLDQVVRQVQLSDVNLTMILHHVHELRQQNARLAHAVLVALLSDRLLTIDEIAWVEKTIVTIVWNYTTSHDLGVMTDALEELLDRVGAETNLALSMSATHAAQVLMLKRIEALYSQADYDQADVWCRLALHKVFGGSGTSNIGKLQRKRLLCALGKTDLATCREIRCQMSESTERDPSTQFLFYKVALKCQDGDLATESLNAIIREPTADSTLLYACVLEAQRIGDRLQVIRALSQILEHTNYQFTHGPQLPALLRLTARMLIQELGNGESQDPHSIDELCKIFEGAAAAAKKSRLAFSENELFPSTELDWFSRNSYNVALKVCTVWKADATLRIVQACSNVGKTADDVKEAFEADCP